VSWGNEPSWLCLNRNSTRPVRGPKHPVSGKRFSLLLKISRRFKEVSPPKVDGSVTRQLLSIESEMSWVNPTMRCLRLLLNDHKKESENKMSSTQFSFFDSPFQDLYVFHFSSCSINHKFYTYRWLDPPILQAEKARFCCGSVAWFGSWPIAVSLPPTRFGCAKRRTSTDLFHW